MKRANQNEIIEALKRHNGNISEVSRELKVSRTKVRVCAGLAGITERGSVQPVAHHSAKTDEIIVRHGKAIGKAVAELKAQFGAGWYGEKVKARAIELGVISPDDDLLRQPKVCNHTEATDDIIRKHKGNILAACKELGWGNNRAVRLRAIELGVITKEKRQGKPPIKYTPSPEADAILLKYPQQIQRCVTLLKWDKGAVRRRMVELGIIKSGKKIDTKKYKHTETTDNIIRQYKGHVATIMDVLGWPYEVILDRAIALQVRKKGERLPRNFKYINPAAIDDVIRKFNYHVLPIHYETGWGKEKIRERIEELGHIPEGDSVTGRVYTYNKMYIPTPEVDSIITTCWTTFKNKRGASAIRTAAERIKEHAKATKTPLWSDAAISNRARELGLVKGRKSSNNMKWTEEENKIILDNAHQTVATIQRKLEAEFPLRPRTQGSITGQMYRLRSDYGMDGFTQRDLSKHLHVSLKTLLRWTARGVLKGTKRDMERTESQGGGFWHYSRKAVRDFIVEYPDEIDTAVIDKYWLLDILTDGKMGKKQEDDKIKRQNKAFYEEA